MRRYLEYHCDSKKQYKIEEKELLDLLNNNLKQTLESYFNSSVVYNITVFNKFPIELLSNIYIILEKRFFILEETIISEKELSADIYFIETGRVTLLHKESKTYIKELEKNKYFGEISFFTAKPRTTTVIAKDFTEIYIIKRQDFYHLADKISRAAKLLFENIEQGMITNRYKKYKELGISCYNCLAYGHIAI